MDIAQRVDICSDSNGGIKELYVFNFVEYGRSKISYSRNTITEFPYSVIYQLDFVNGSFNENVEDVDGGVSYKQKLVFKFKKVREEDDCKSFAEKDLRFIIRTQDDKYRLIGTHTGVKGKFTKETGENRSDFNGFSFDFETEEERTAGWLTDLSGFDVNGELSLNEILETIL